jgi:hypothetical protein
MNKNSFIKDTALFLWCSPRAPTFNLEISRILARMKVIGANQTPSPSHITSRYYSASCKTHYQKHRLTKHSLTFLHQHLQPNCPTISSRSSYQNRNFVRRYMATTNQDHVFPDLEDQGQYLETLPNSPYPIPDAADLADLQNQVSNYNARAPAETDNPTTPPGQPTAWYTLSWKDWFVIVVLVLLALAVPCLTVFFGYLRLGRLWGGF